jgi:hypothetical protein
MPRGGVHRHGHGDEVADVALSTGVKRPLDEVRALYPGALATSGEDKKTATVVARHAFLSRL